METMKTPVILLLTVFVCYIAHSQGEADDRTFGNTLKKICADISNNNMFLGFYNHGGYRPQPYRPYPYPKPCYDKRADCQKNKKHCNSKKRPEIRYHCPETCKVCDNKPKGKQIYLCLYWVNSKFLHVFRMPKSHAVLQLLQVTVLALSVLWVRFLYVPRNLWGMW